MRVIMLLISIFFCLTAFLSCSDQNLNETADEVISDGDIENNDSDADGQQEDQTVTVDEEDDILKDGDILTDQDYSDSEQEDVSADEDVPAEDIFVKVTVSESPVISLVAIVEVETAREAQVFVKFNKPFEEGSETSLTEKGTQHRIIVAGMKAETLYEFEIVALENGAENIFKTSFTTGSLPESLPEYRFDVLLPEKVSKGITIIPSSNNTPENPEFIGIDENFDIVWYLPAGFFSTEDRAARFLTMADDGTLVLYNGNETVIANIGGETIRSIENIELGIEIHHDVRKTSEGKLIALLKERRDSTVDWVDGPVKLISDVVVVINDLNQIEWSWNSFDHLDKSSFPSELSKTVIGANIYDWTHGNSIDVKDDETMVCLRHQHQAVNFDRNSGELLWKFGGEHGDFVLKNMDRQNGVDWFYGPHNASRVSDNEILLFDNGNDRPAGSSITTSRAVLYKIDETKMEAEQTWQFVLDHFYVNFGSAQKINGGNFLVCGGGAPMKDGEGNDVTGSKIYELTGDDPGQIVWKLEMPEEVAYRAVKYPSMYSNK